MAKLLLVEDNVDNREMLVRRLERRGYTVIYAEDGAQGIELTRSERPDLVLMDMDLPVIDGWKASSILKGDAETQRIPIIGLSANAMQGDAEKAIASGCDDYDTKPVEIARLLEKIQKWLGS